MATIKMVIQLRRATTAEWLANKDVVPAAGEPCFDLDLNTLKIGDGVKTYEQLDVIGGDGSVSVSADGNSIILEDGVFKLAGFDAAEVGAQPRKNAEGFIEWAIPTTDENMDRLMVEVDALQTNVTNLQTTVTTLQEIVTPSGEDSVPLLSRIETLEEKMDGTGEGSVDAKIDAKINEFAAKVSDDGIVNTLKELVDYVATHGPEVADMAADILELQGLVGDTPVDEQILAIVNESGHMAEDKAKAVFEHVKYEIAHKPDGVLVDYRDKEIRVMCPSDTEWTLQNVGSGGNGSTYYIGFKAYAPSDDVVSFKEDLAEIIADNTMYSFEGNEFAGVDEYGRKYSIVWLPVAVYDADTATWTYHGTNSSTAKYIGWYYSVEWYNADGKKVASDCIRISLTNEDCHSAIEPFYMTNVVKGVRVDGALLDMVDGIVDITMPEATMNVKASEEITIAEDGTLGIGKISFSKITQEEDETVVLDGGGAAD